ncbi:hypothetical protein [Kitasatospora sp. MAP5-34]|uniref:hypothetical protein n=1 Tax=Kitasatospora sp. MAP5-34 TaxID=3035102 RepID=UPI002477225C|nr:hypothetical protein [Kitasatospora sp. MAP5-34]MDH6576403.1 hypothetical protein [Kitasatospora sp. MAP5-34]
MLQPPYALGERAVHRSLQPWRHPHVHEAALLESRTLRESLSERVDALDKVKALSLLPDGVHVTTQMVADYFEVGERAVNSLVQRHRAELEGNGFVVLRPVDNSGFVGFNLKPTQVRGRWMAIYPRRAVLNIAMLLRDSEVARSVRRYLLDAERAGREPQAGPYLDFDFEGMAVELERRLLAGTVGERLARCEAMLIADRVLVGAMSARLCEVAADVRELRRGRWVWRR